MCQCPGELNTYSKHFVKSVLDHTCRDDSCRTYDRWPQELCFIGPEWCCIKYNDMTHSQWVADVTAIAAEETNLVV